MHYEPAEPGLPPENVLEHRRGTSTSCRRCSSGLREEFGAERAPAARRAPPADADRGRRAWASALEPYHLFWMEDPVPAELQEGFRLIRQHTTTPIAVGEVFNTHPRLPAR